MIDNASAPSPASPISVPRVTSNGRVQRRTRSLFSPRVWPLLRRAGAPRRTSIAVACAGLVGALALGGPGIGYPITAVAVLVAIACARPERPGPWHAAGAVAVVALSSVAAFRSAEWIVVLAMWAAVVVTGVVLAGAWTWRGIVLGALTPVLVPIRASRWLSRGVKRVDAPTVHAGRIVAVAGSTALLVLVFASLFAAADPQFERIVDAATPEWNPESAVARVVVFLLVAGGALAASYVAVNRPRFDGLARPPRYTVALWEWAVPVGALVLVFCVFVALQVTTLFGGQNHVLVTDGLTNAEYARQGFWQLLVVTALTLLVMAVVIRRATRKTVADRSALRVLLGLLCVLSLVVVASALHRMSLYEQQYGYTTLRLFVTAVELLLGSVFLMVMATGVRMSGRWLPRAVGVGAVMTVLALAVLNPDAYIARHNVERFTETGKIDIQYLRGLSTDAAPELAQLPEPYRSCVLPGARVAESWREWNLADSRAAEIERRARTASCATLG